MITNPTRYTSELSRSIKSKLYCLPYLTQCDLIVDFGCANGAVLFAIGNQLEEPFLIGYDNNPVMIQQAVENAPPNTIITKDWDVVTHYVKKAKCPAIILSSVLHEVYDQGLQNEVWAKMPTSPLSVSGICA